MILVENGTDKDSFEVTKAISPSLKTLKESATVSGPLEILSKCLTENSFSRRATFEFFYVTVKDSCETN